jgi:vanillate O-demethylase monooxygenase subunit
MQARIVAQAGARVFGTLPEARGIRPRLSSMLREPTPETLMFVRNCWYVIAWDHEVEPGKLFSRTVLGEPILLYRRADGAIAALEDRCCHRLAPLSKGRLEGDCVRCGYHGMKFDASGRCVEIPGLDVVPPKARVRTYPITVKNRWVFVWMGDEDRIDPGLLPDNYSCDHPEHHYRPGYMHYETPYMLICDNLLDFSHLSYVHEKTLGGSPKVAQSKPRVEKLANGIKVSRRVPDVPPPPYYHRMKTFEGNVDRWFIYDFVLPGTLLMHSGGRPVSDAESDMRRAVELHSCQTLTPETEQSTHYFFQQSPRMRERDDEIVESTYRSLISAFNEDRDMITAQFRSIELDPTKSMLPLAMDAALMQWRRLVEERVAAERAAPCGAANEAALA